MKITALVFATCLLTTPALAQEWDPYGEILEDIFEPPTRGSDNPALDREMDRWDREEERAERHLRMQYMHEERARNHALGTCATIWNNPAARAECRRSYGGQ